MNSILLQVLLPLTSAHLLGDFIFQSDNDVKNKKRYSIFIKHILILTLLSYLLTGMWNDYIIPLSILVSHTIIDLLKKQIKKDTFILFAADQFAHLLVIMILVFYMQPAFESGDAQSYWYNIFGNGYLVTLTIASALIMTTKVSSIIVTYTIKPVQFKLFQSDSSEIQINTGRLVGQLERTIILLLFIADMPAVIGFLITAKSILRYGEIKNEKDKSMVEYILIGTLISFALGIAIGYSTTEFIKLIN
ncbi:MAG: DUF3307 domain-containing protein [Ignavibacteriales bacterium]|nr:MAG: DUF3307 domain-containing protein [Ignavibacteriales bacterium]